MNNSTPISIRIVDRYNDGKDARHYSFAPVDKDNFSHDVKPGQFFMLSVPGYGEAAFTYSSLPDENGVFTALVRKVGSLTGAVFNAQTNSILGHRGPFGKGWPLQEISGKRLLVIAGGCGLAPLVASVNTLLQDSGTQVAVIHGSYDSTSRVLNRELARWREKKLLLLETTDVEEAGKPVGTPLDHAEKVIETFGAEPEAVFCCGPDVMMQATARFFIQRGMLAERIWLSLERRMHCGTGLCGHCYLADSYVCKDGPTYRWDEFQQLEAKCSARHGTRTETPRTYFC